MRLVHVGLQGGLLHVLRTTYTWSLSLSLSLSLSVCVCVCVCLHGRACAFARACVCLFGSLMTHERNRNP